MTKGRERQHMEEGKEAGSAAWSRSPRAGWGLGLSCCPLAVLASRTRKEALVVSIPGQENTENTFFRVSEAEKQVTVFCTP